MCDSTERPARRRRLRAAALAVCAALLLPAALADDGTIRIRESALDEFADALLPLTWEGRIRIQLGFVGVEVPAEAEVTRLEFDIEPGGVFVDIEMSGRVDGFDWSRQARTSLMVILDEEAGVLRFIPFPILIRPTITDLNIPVPLVLNLTDAVTVPAFPLTHARVEVATPHGTRTLRALGRNLMLTRETGNPDNYLEIRGDVGLH